MPVSKAVKSFHPSNLTFTGWMLRFWMALGAFAAVILSASSIVNVGDGRE
jgi:hypothetical protein